VLRCRERGDTLIEVLVAFGVFSLAVVGSMAVMNQGSAVGQRAIETSLVRQEINSQAEAIRFLHDSYVASYEPGQTAATVPSGPVKEWLTMEEAVIANGATNATDITQIGNTCPTPPNGSFVIDIYNAKYIPKSSGKLAAASTYAQLGYATNASTGAITGFTQSQGIWVEAIRSKDSTDPYQAHIGYIDFYIFGCWPSLGQNKASTLGTIVRLYAPR